VADKPFLTDIKTLRDRARQHIENGAVTEGYSADRETVVKLLNEALATEIVCVLRYRRHYFMATGINAESVAAAIARASAAHGPARILMNIAGIGTAKRIVQKDGNAAPLEDFARVVNINLIGTYNVSRLFAAECARQTPLEDGERGVMLFTASVAAFDGQVGQQAYSASKGGLVGMTLPMARDLAQHAIRVCTVAPGLFATPLLLELPEVVQHSLAASIPFPPRLGKPSEFAELACHIVTNGHLNGEVIRLDGALRMAPR